MYIALDFDDTYTRDPSLWTEFIQDAVDRGHTVFCVTLRLPSQGEQVLNTIGRTIGPSMCYFTSMQSKKNYMWKQGIKIDVWIDDMPDAIVSGIDTHINNGIIFP
jgi:hypothetical protein